MKTILVIDDEQAARQAIKNALEPKGFQVIDATNEPAGIEMVTTYHPDLVVCDVVMAEGDGYSVLDALRQDQSTTAIPFIFLSAKADKADIRQGMNLGADDFLTKPFTDEELLNAIHARLNRKEAIATPYQQELKRAIDSLNQVAFYDSVTRLPNLILLHQTLEEQLSRVNDQTLSLNNATIAVLNIHVLHQDWVARSNNLPLSEPLLRAIAKRLKTFAERSRAPFSGLVTRLGSHQFALVLYNDDTAHDMVDAINELMSALEAPYEIDQYPVKIVVKIGGARCPQDGLTASALFSRAEIAAHHCVSSDNARHQFYIQTMEADYYRYKRLLGDIQSAIDHNEFSLLYQPQLNTISERITGIEALLRWQHPELGQIAYDQFIAIAEEAQILPQLGRWVVQTACMQLKEWRSLTLIPLRLSINIWRQQLQDSFFVEHLLEAVRQADLDPKQLVLDIDEASLVTFDHEVIAPILQEITATGIQIAVDEFGMHGMPIRYLRTLPVHILKPGRDLVRGIVKSEEDAIMTEMVIELAHRLNLKTHAKWVATDQHLALLTRYGCHTVQGYQYSKPLPPDQLQEMLSKGLSETIYPS
ncbi:MAG: EAL domain-containing protein [Leptolyngbyaceae bacterium]|nr:EAL domain-containing protein [Leptolyngbyaceae bacterium]